MFSKNKRLSNLIYIILILLLIYFSKFSTNNLNAENYVIKNVNLVKPYDLNFNKLEVIEAAFELAFNDLISRIVFSGDAKQIENIDIEKIKKLINSFSITEEKFIDNNYYANFEVNFNKKNMINFLDQMNVSSAIPITKKILILPILLDIDQKEIILFSENFFFNEWNKKLKRNNLLIYTTPNEDLEDLKIIQDNLENIEDFDFNEIISKYDLSDYIITIFYKNKKDLKVLSKININKNLSILNHSFQNLNFKNDKTLLNIIELLQASYEDEWKKNNQINTSIKLSLTISIDSKNFQLINKFEEDIVLSDLVSRYNIETMSNESTIYKIVYNGTPDKFLKEFEKNGFKIDVSSNIWTIK